MTCPAMALALLAIHFLMLGLHRTAERDVAMSPYYFYVVAIIDREKFLTTARRILRVNSRLVAFNGCQPG